MGRQLGEAYVFCNRCLEFAHLTGDIVDINGHTFFDPDKKQCRCGNKNITVLDLHVINVYNTGPHARQTGRRYARYLPLE